MNQDILDEPGALVEYMSRTRPIAPVALGSMLLHGWHRWGDKWVLSAAKGIAKLRRSQKS